MLAEAKTIYQRALKIKDIPNSKRSDAKLRIAIIYKESKKWDFAKTFLLDILETLADNVASISSSQLVLTQ
jgi:2-phospho-L-lactate guanylyltransferase (CobY/MobA/RfbA family)